MRNRTLRPALLPVLEPATRPATGAFAGGGEPPGPTAPAAFSGSDWSIAAGYKSASVTIDALPDDGGSEITDVEYSIDAGDWVSTGGTVSFDIENLESGVEISVSLRAVNAIGNGTASAPKTVTPTYDADAEALFAAMTVEPDFTRKTLINITILALKSGGFWAKLDRLWVMAAHDAQAARLNWKAPSSGALIPINSPIFTTDTGYASDGSTSYLDTDFVLSTDGVQFTLNSACLFARIEDTYAVNLATPIGVFPTSGFQAYIRPWVTGATMRGTLNSGTPVESAARADTKGLAAVNRTSSTNVQLYDDDGQQVASTTSSSAGLSAVAPFVCAACNTAGAPAGFMPAGTRLSFAGLGASLGGTTEYATFISILSDYMSGL